MITPKEIARKTMTENKRKEAKNDFFSYYIGRPITYVLTVPFLYTNISPNTVTFISVLFALAGFIVCCIAQTSIILTVGWFLFFLWSMFDGIDGNIARYKKQYSKLGTVYDTMGGYIAIIGMLLGASIAAFRNTVLLDNWIDYGNYRYLILIAGSLSCIFDLFPRLMMHNILSTLKDDANVDNVKDKSGYNFFEIVALNITSPSGGMMVLFIVAIWVQILDVFTYGYFLFNLLKMLVSLFLMFRRAGRDENSTAKDINQDADGNQNVFVEGEDV